MDASITSRFRRRVSESSARHPFLATSVMIAAVTAFGLSVVGALRTSNIDALYTLVVFVSALRWGRRPSLFAAMVSAVVFDFCFIPPRFSFATTDFPYVITLLVFVLIAVATSELASRAHDMIREQAARKQAEAVAEAKDALLNRIAHELRAPLTTILGWVQILEQNAGDAQRVSRSVAGLQRNAQLLARLVGDLLDVSRIHVGKLRVRLQPVGLAPIVSRALEDASIAAIEKNVRLEVDIHPVGTALADEHRVEQIVTNLVSNALKFTPAGGCVSVTLREEGGFAKLLVADTGVGIPAEFVPHLFEPFAQGHLEINRQGLGLGLAIVKHLVEAHQGRISVDCDAPGHGTTFVVEIPIGDLLGAVPRPDLSIARAIEPDDRTAIH